MHKLWWNFQQLTKEVLWLGGHKVEYYKKVIQRPGRQEDGEECELDRLTSVPGGACAWGADSTCEWPECQCLEQMLARSQRGRRWDLLCLSTRPITYFSLCPLTGFTIHFWRLLLSQALRRSLASWGRIKDWGKKLNSFLPKRLCIRDRFRHSRSFLPIWKEPGKWFSYGRDKRQREGKGRGETMRNKLSPTHHSNIPCKVHVPFYLSATI